jgi:hypothetical protein
VEVAGRVLTANGRGISKATVVMTDAGGNQRVVITNPFGYFRFTNVQVGATYVFTVSHKSYEFLNAAQVYSIDDARNDIVFVAVESLSQVVIARRFGLIENLQNLQPAQARRGFKCDRVAALVTEQGDC